MIVKQDTPAGSDGVVKTEDVAHPKYRPDIDGLRAVAVLSVMVYHAFPDLLRGGFVGVDVFFVISGFLISTIIFNSHAQDRFSFRDFYARRIRRIFPALFTVLASVMIAGWLLLYPEEYHLVGKHVAAGAGFVSNFVLWGESGYFDTAAEVKPLLHLWSLGIEEQFYIFFPLIVWLLWRFRLNVLVFVLVMGVASFLLNMRYIFSDPSWTFYQPQSRVWELLIGSTLALLMIDRSGTAQALQMRLDQRLAAFFGRTKAVPGATLADLKSVTGLLCLGAGLGLVTKASAFPGAWALLPTVGSMLLIWAGPDAVINRRFLASRPMVWVGIISYPLYLWHWPLLVFPRLWLEEHPSAVIRLGMLLLTVIAAWLTYRLIERPLRFGQSRWKTVGLLMAMLSLGGAGYAVYKMDGVLTRRVQGVQDQSSVLLDDLKQAKSIALTDVDKASQLCFQMPPRKDFAFFHENPCLPPAGEAPEARKGPIAMLIGDSHSASLSQGLRPWMQDHGIPFYQISSGACSLLSDDDSDPACQEYSRQTYEAVRAVKPDLLLVDSHWFHALSPAFFKNRGGWPSNIDYLQNQLRQISGLGARKVIIVGQMPTWVTDLPSLLVREYVSRFRGIPERGLAGLDMRSLAMDDVLRGLSYPAGFSYVPLRDVLCTPEGCLIRLSPDLRHDLVVWDYGHLTTPGAKFVIDRILGAEILKQLGR